jgi:chorismate mutase/prephenate dehydratase
MPFALDLSPYLYCNILNNWLDLRMEKKRMCLFRVEKKPLTTRYLNKKAEIKEHKHKTTHCKQLEKLNQGPLTNESLKAIYREIVSASIQLQKPISIAYLGPNGTFSHQVIR